MYWIHVEKDREHWWAIVGTLMNSSSSLSLGISWLDEELLASPG
jgi:hypothetical protein